MLELLDSNIKITVIKILKDLVGKVQSLKWIISTNIRKLEPDGNN